MVNGSIQQRGCTVPGLFAALLLTPTLLLAGEPETIRISGSSWIHDAPTRIAEMKGYFHGPGPGVEVGYQPSGKASLQRMLAGDADFALVAAIPMARALLESRNPARPDPADPVVLGSISLSNQTHHVLAVRDRGIEEPGDLAGRRVGVLFDTSAEFFWSLFAPMHGLDPDAAELVDLPLEDMAGALKNGEVDAVVTWDPWLYRLQRDVSTETVAFSQRQIYTLNWLLVTRRHTVQDHPEVTDRILRGYMRAIESLLRNPDQSLQQPGTEGELPDDYLRKIQDKVIFHLALNWSVVTNIEQAFDWLKATRDMKGVKRPRPDVYLEPGPLSRVSPERMLLPDMWMRSKPEDGR